jgi:hypothetical protein
MKNKISNLEVIFPENITESGPIEINVSCIINNVIEINNLVGEILNNQINFYYPTPHDKDIPVYKIIDKKVRTQLTLQVLNKYAEKVNPGVDYKLKVWHS